MVGNWGWNWEGKFPPPVCAKKMLGINRLMVKLSAQVLIYCTSVSCRGLVVVSIRG